MEWRWEEVELELVQRVDEDPTRCSCFWVDDGTVGWGRKHRGEGVGEMDHGIMDMLILRCWSEARSCCWVCMGAWG